MPNPSGDSEPSAAALGACASNPLCHEIMKCKKIPAHHDGPPAPAPAIVKTCKSVGDPHVYPFEKARFDTHLAGWVTLFKKDKLVIDAEQKVWAANNVGVAINRAVRYSTDGGTTFTTMENGQASDVNFGSPKVKLTVRARDYSTRRNIHADCKFIYDLFVTTANYTGASGQCVQGKLPTDKSDEIPFPTGDAVKVGEDAAKAACAGISDPELRADCVTDVRMVNDPDTTDKLVDGFKDVESIDETLASESKCMQCAKHYAKLGFCRCFKEECPDHFPITKHKGLEECEPCGGAAMEYCKTYSPTTTTTVTATTAAKSCPSGQYKRGRWFAGSSFNCRFGERLLGELFHDTWPATDNCRQRVSRWNHQVIISQSNQGGKSACIFYSLIARRTLPAHGPIP
jgi:hypothetical protein